MTCQLGKTVSFRNLRYDTQLVGEMVDIRQGRSDPKPPLSKKLAKSSPVDGVGISLPAFLLCTLANFLDFSGKFLEIFWFNYETGLA